MLPCRGKLTGYGNVGNVPIALSAEAPSAGMNKASILLPAV